MGALNDSANSERHSAIIITIPPKNFRDDVKIFHGFEGESSGRFNNILGES